MVEFFNRFGPQIFTGGVLFLFLTCVAKIVHTDRRIRQDLGLARKKKIS